MIADIGGYTPFMRLHRMSLAHAQDVVARLLEAMIDAAPGLALLEAEGDAAFLYRWTPDGQEISTVRKSVDQMVAMPVVQRNDALLARGEGPAPAKVADRLVACV